MTRFFVNINLPNNQWKNNLSVFLQYTYFFLNKNLSNGLSSESFLFFFNFSNKSFLAVS